MERNVYFEGMRETSSRVIPVLKAAYSNTFNSALYESLQFFLSKRTLPGQRLLRPYLVRLAYELSGRNDWENIVPACAAIEIFNISTYQSNVAFDKKSNSFSEAFKNNQFICSMISLNKAIELLLSLKIDYGNPAILQICDRVNQVNSDIYEGQSYDLNDLHVSSIDFTMSAEEYLEKYYTPRCANIGGSLISLCLEVGATLGNFNPESTNVLVKIGSAFGTAGQMLNDISDFVLPTQNQDFALGYRKQFGDILNGKITYPLFYAIKYGNDSGKSVLLDVLNSRRSLDLKTKMFITGYLIKTGAINSAKKQILGYYRKLKKEIKNIPHNISRDLLSLSFSSLLTNKYFAVLRDFDLENYNPCDEEHPIKVKLSKNGRKTDP